MRFSVAIGGLALAAVTVASAAVAATGAPTGGFVAGAGTITEGGFSFSITAGAHGDAGSGQGVTTLAVGEERYVGAVDCVLVFEHSALIVATLKHTVGDFTKIVTEIVDNGNGAHDPPDAALSGLATGGHDDCHPTLVDFSDALPITHGNFVVSSS